MKLYLNGRFLSWCPPEAAFKVADSLGFYLWIELPFWSLTVRQDAGTNVFVQEEAKRSLSNLFEANCLNGKLVVCSRELLDDQAVDPVKKQLLYSLIHYMQSDAFVPTQTVAFENIQSLVRPNLRRGNRASPDSIY